MREDQIKQLRRPLSIEEIDFRIQSINKGKYATILAYKDARADMNRLDEVVTPMGWKREHSRDNQNCIVSIWDETKAQWIGKEDTGTESNTEKEKGLASDSFKRACFNWGIGRELYDYPVIKILLLDDEVEEKNGKMYPTWKLQLKNWKWKSEWRKKENGEDELVFLSCMDNNGKIRYNYEKYPVKKETKKQPAKTEVKETAKVTDKMVIEINDIKTVDELKKYYENHPELHKTKLFNQLVTQRKKIITDGISN